jgi:hypothetical protein
MQPNITGNSRPLKLEGRTPAQIGSGSNFPAIKLMQVFSPDDWEGAISSEFSDAMAVGMRFGLFAREAG